MRGPQQQWIVDLTKMSGYMLKNRKTQTCINTQGLYQITMTPCDQWDINQRWTLYDNGHLKNMRIDNSLCLNSYGFNVGTPLELLPCKEHTLRYWAYNPTTENINLVGDPRILIGVDIDKHDQPVLMSSSQSQDMESKWIFSAPNMKSLVLTD